MLPTQRTSAQKRRSYSADMFDIFDVLDAHSMGALRYTDTTASDEAYE
jgi:hypothetical protein